MGKNSPIEKLGRAEIAITNLYVDSVDENKLVEGITFSSTIVALFEDYFLFRLQKYNKIFKTSRLLYLDFAKMHTLALQTLLKCIFDTFKLC